MNPATLLRLARAFEKDPARAAHVLRIGAEAGTWPATVYRATQLGYLRRISPAWFVATTDLWDEVRLAEHNRRRKVI